MKHTEEKLKIGKMHDDGSLFILSDQSEKYICNVQIRQTCGGAIAAAMEEMRKANAKHLVKCWNAFNEGGLVDDLLKALRNGANPAVFNQFANFTEECMTKPSMAVYRQQFAGLATFLRSCVGRSEEALQAIAKAKESK